jgi:hypothetical protein
MSAQWKRIPRQVWKRTESAIKGIFGREETRRNGDGGVVERENGRKQEGRDTPKACRLSAQIKHSQLHHQSSREECVVSRWRQTADDRLSGISWSWRSRSTLRNGH